MVEHNHAYAERFDEVFDELFRIGAVAPGAIDRLVRGGDGRVVSSLLELGVGNGRYAVVVAEQGVTTVGLDIAPAMLERSRRHAAAVGVDVELVVGDCRSFDCAPRTFDAVAVLGGTFGMFDRGDQRRILETCRRAVAPHGRVVVETHERRGVDRWLRSGRVTELRFPRRDRSDVAAISTYDSATGAWRLDYRWSGVGGCRMASEVSFPLTVGELSELADDCGLRVTAATAGWTRQPATKEEVVMVVTLERREDEP